MSDRFVSVVAPLRNDAATVGAFVSEIVDVLRRHYTEWELVLVDDGSTDGTVVRVTALQTEYPYVRLLRLSRQFGAETATAAGLDSVIGDVVVVMIPNTDPPALVPELVANITGEVGVAYGIRSNRVRQPMLIRAGAAMFYWYCRAVLGLALPKNAAPFRSMSRQAVNALVRMRDRCRYLPVLTSYIGFDTRGIVYDPIDRNGNGASRGFVEAINLGISVIASNSRHPLRFVTWLGVAAGVFNALYSLYIIGVYLLKPQVAEGWTTLSLQSGAMFFFVFLILVVLSEYIGYMLVQAADRPLYYVREERNGSDLPIDALRRNVDTAAGVARDGRWRERA